MKILVTGGGGFLGKYIVKGLIEKGHTVSNFSRSEYPDLKKMGVTCFTGDIASLTDVEMAIQNHDAVFHVASKVGMWGRWSDFYKTNVIGTKNIIDSCKKLGIKKLIYTSTPSVVFGKNDLEGVNEEYPIQKKFLNHYGKSKSMAETLVRQANDTTLSTVSLRPHLILGPGDPHLFPRTIKLAKQGKLKIIGNGKNIVDVIHVQDAANAHIKALEQMNSNSAQKICGKVYFIGQEEPVVLWDFINIILEKNNLPPVKKKIPTWMAYTTGLIMELVFKIFLPYSMEPPMTRFTALQLSKSHYFSHENAKKYLNFHAAIDLTDKEY